MLADLQPIGFSTGCLYKTHDPVARATFDCLKELGATAIEISPQSNSDLVRLRDQLKASQLGGFSYISLHPKKSSFHGDKIAEALTLIREIYEIIGCQVVVHPNEVADLDMLRGVGFPILFENMDARNSSYIAPEEFHRLFERIDAGLVLDINHCYTNDRSLKLAERFLEQHGQALAEIHLSGYDTFHEPLCVTGQREILDMLPAKAVPIIIESGCATLDIAQAELDLVVSYLRARS